MGVVAQMVLHENCLRCCVCGSLWVPWLLLLLLLAVVVVGDLGKDRVDWVMQLDIYHCLYHLIRVGQADISMASLSTSESLLFGNSIIGGWVVSGPVGDRLLNGTGVMYRVSQREFPEEYAHTSKEKRERVHEHISLLHLCIWNQIPIVQ